MNYLDLFSGIGGFHLGLKMAGFNFDKVYYSDIEEYSNKVYAKNFPSAIPLGDVTKINPEELPRIDIITGGFPCQDISCAGKQKGIKGERSGLFGEIIRIASAVRPKVLFMENVANLVSGGNGEWLYSVLAEINAIGYDAEWEVISASFVGAPHRRKRIWIVAYPKRGRRSCQVSEHRKKTNNWPKPLATRSVLQGATAKHWEVEPEVGRVAHGIPKRVDRLKGLGNAVVPQVVQLIGEMILSSGLLEA